MTNPLFYLVEPFHRFFVGLFIFLELILERLHLVLERLHGGLSFLSSLVRGLRGGV